MADSGDIDNGFSLMLDSDDLNGEAMAQPNTYPFHTEMSHLFNEQYGNNMVTRAGNFHQNAHIPYSESAPNQSTTTDNIEWNQTVSNQCTTPNHDFYQSVPNTESTTSDSSWHQSISPNHNPYQSVLNPANTTSDYHFHQSISPDHNWHQSVPDHNRHQSVPDPNRYQSVPNTESTTSDYSWHQSISPNHNPHQSVLNPASTTSDYRFHQSISPDNNWYQSFPMFSYPSTTMHYSGHQPVKPHEVMNIPPIQSDDCNKSEQMAHIALPSSMESSTSSVLEESKLGWRVKIKYTEEQKAIFESYFQRNSYPDYRTKCQIASECGVNERQIHNWFMNRRARPRKNTEKNETETGTTQTTSSHPIQMQQESSSTQEGI